MDYRFTLPGWLCGAWLCLRRAREQRAGTYSSQAPVWYARLPARSHLLQGPSLGSTLMSLLPSSCFEELVDSAQRKIQDSAWMNFRVLTGDSSKLKPGEATAARVLGADARVKNFGSILQGTFLEGQGKVCWILFALERSGRKYNVKMFLVSTITPDMNQNNQNNQNKNDNDNENEDENENKKIMRHADNHNQEEEEVLMLAAVSACGCILRWRSLLVRRFLFLS